MLYILIEQYKYAVEKVNTTLAKMELELKKYADKPGANKTAVQIRNEQIQTIHDTITASKNLLTEYDKTRAENELLKREINNLKKKIKPEKFIDRWDKELLRDASVDRVRNKWPELF